MKTIRNTTILISLVCIAGIMHTTRGLLTASTESNMDQPVVVDSVDLERYTGTWYEIAKIPNRFQKQCVRNTTATYTLRDDGKIRVVNRCETEDGTVDEAEGVARVVDQETNAKLEVSFVRLLGLQLFWGDYWIIGLDPDYHYAIVGHPEYKYGWILSRKPRLSDRQWKEVKTILRENGYDFSRFERTGQ